VIQEQPIAGVGMDVFTWRANDILRSPTYQGPGKNLRGDHVHNIVLLVISELGFVGFTFWILTLVVGFWIVWRRVYDPSTVGLIAGVVALLAVGLFDHYPWTVFHFALLIWGALAVGVRNAASKALN
jgi:O-antigen ligase